MQKKKFSIKKIVFLTLLMVLALVGFHYYQALFQEKNLRFNFHQVLKKGSTLDNWIEFSPEGKTFSVFLPKEPTPIAKTLLLPGGKGSLPYQEYRCQHLENCTISISYTILPDQWVRWSPGFVLKGALSILMRELRGPNLVGKSSNTFKNYPALDYEHYLQTMETAGTLILVGNTLYKIEMTYPMEKRESIRDDLARFINSFTPKEIGMEKALQPPALPVQEQQAVQQETTIEQGITKEDVKVNAPETTAEIPASQTIKTEKVEEIKASETSKLETSTEEIIKSISFLPIQEASQPISAEPSS
ncbi:MAG: hypothetical protein HYZ47_02930 [Simkania negevensis]|nr:hypothetical protein [Simkania negevensis]